MLKYKNVPFRIDEIYSVNINNLYYYKSWRAKVCVHKNLISICILSFLKKSEKIHSDAQTSKHVPTVFYEIDYLKIIL